MDQGNHYEQPVLAKAFNLWVDIHAPVGNVFDFLTEEHLLSRWWATRCTSEARPGGRLACWWEGERELSGVASFRQFERPTRLVIEWLEYNGDPIRGDGEGPRGMRWPALNIFELCMINGSTTRLHLHDMGIHPGEAYAPLRQATAQGWLETLSQLKRTAEEVRRQALIKRRGKTGTGKQTGDR